MNASTMKYDLDSFLTFLLEEVVKADMSMHDRQLEAWRHFSKYKPQGEHINEDIDEGWATSRYLSLNEVKLKFYVRIVPDSFRKRIIQGIRYMIGKYNPQAFHLRKYEFTDLMNPDSIEISVTVKQEEHGKIRISYQPADSNTNAVFLTSPFLQRSKNR